MNSFKFRVVFVIVIVSSIFLGIVVRLGYLMVYKHEFFLARSESQIKKLIKIDTSRGRILDRNMHPLAISKPVESIYVSPRQIKDKKIFSQDIAPLIGLSSAVIYEKINNSSNFVWLRRKVDDVDIKALRQFPQNQINVLKEEIRVYPNDELLSDVLGFVGMDGGLGGVEFEFNQFLTGETGYYLIQGDPRGVRIITSSKTLIGRAKGFSEGKSGLEASSLKGGNLVLTIDYRVQFLVERYLEDMIQKVEANAGQVIVMDVKNGDIMAMANYPFFNSNQFQQVQYSTLKNSCIVDVFEPGSTFKLITYAAALEEGVITPETIMEIPETVVIARRTIQEAHKRDPDDPDIYAAKEIITKSMNVGTTLLVDKMGGKVFFDYIQSFGFGQKTQVHLPGETKGILRSRDRVTPIDSAVMSFGQGISVTGLQMTAAIAAIANDGVYVSPRVIKYQTDHNNLTLSNMNPVKSRRVISRQTSKQVLAAMESVVLRGTGRRAAVHGYRVGGKTGTAQKPLENGLGYQEDAYIASFVGVLPIQNPRYVIFIAVDDPKTSIWGSASAAPLFSKISKVMINFYDIEPDLSKIKPFIN